MYRQLLNSVPELEERLVGGTPDEISTIADFVSNCDLVMSISFQNSQSAVFKIRKGASGARGDDTKSLKGAIIEWITPKGQALNPPLSRNAKVDRGFNHERTGSLLCPADLDWTDKESVSLHISLSLFPTSSRIKLGLRTGEMLVSGDQWPIFLYIDRKYDPEDPWRGLFRNQILVAACLIHRI